MTTQKKFHLFAVLLVGVICIPAMAQKPAPAPTPHPAKTTPVTDVNRVILETKLAAPQVVTILHRLNGLKFLTLLRSREDFEAIAQLDRAFKLAGDVHTNVIAGLALDDDKQSQPGCPSRSEMPRRAHLRAEDARLRELQPAFRKGDTSAGMAPNPNPQPEVSATASTPGCKACRQ